MAVPSAEAPRPSSVSQSIVPKGGFRLSEKDDAPSCRSDGDCAGARWLAPGLSQCRHHRDGGDIQHVAHQPGTAVAGIHELQDLYRGPQRQQHTEQEQLLGHARQRRLCCLRAERPASAAHPGGPAPPRPARPPLPPDARRSPDAARPRPGPDHADPLSRRSPGPWCSAPPRPADPGTPPRPARAAPTGSGARPSRARSGRVSRRRGVVIAPHHATRLDDPLEQPSAPRLHQRSPAADLPHPSLLIRRDGQRSSQRGG